MFFYFYFFYFFLLAVVFFRGLTPAICHQVGLPGLCSRTITFLEPPPSPQIFPDLLCENFFFPTLESLETPKGRQPEI